MAYNRRFQGPNRRFQAPTWMPLPPRYQLQAAWKRVPCPSLMSSWDSRRSSIREWEEQFGMKWRRFLASKECISEEDKVMKWDDSAGKMGFFEAERRFWSKNNRLSNAPLPSPDLYIDCIDWDSRIDPKLLMELEAAREDGKRSVLAMETTASWPSEIKLEDIKPTGWIVCCEDWNKPIVLTGMVVGGSHGEYFTPMNCQPPRENFYEGGNYKPSIIDARKSSTSIYHQANHQGTCKQFVSYRSKSENFSQNRGAGC